MKEDAGVVVGSLHEEARDSSRMNHNKSNREGDGEKGTGQGAQHVEFDIEARTFCAPSQRINRPLL